MSLKGLEPAPLNPDAGRLAELEGRLKVLAEWDSATVDEDAILTLSGDVADALHMGEIDFPDHDRLSDAIREVHGNVR